MNAQPLSSYDFEVSEAQKEIAALQGQIEDRIIGGADPSDSECARLDALLSAAKQKAESVGRNRFYAIAAAKFRVQEGDFSYNQLVHETSAIGDWGTQDWLSIARVGDTRTDTSGRQIERIA